MSTATTRNQAGRIGSRGTWSRRAGRGSASTAEGSQPGVSDRGPRLPSSPSQLPWGRREVAASVAPEAPGLDRLDRRLLDACRRGFPICENPFAELARRLDDRDGEVLRRFEELERRGVLSRIGPVPAPAPVAASTLVAMAVPKARLRSIAETVIRYRGVDHLCEREHQFNLWFALAAPNAGELYDKVADIRRRTGVEVLDLRLERDYCGDLELPPSRRTPPGLCSLGTEASRPGRCPSLDESDRRLLAAIQEGLSLASRPYAVVAKRAGITEAQVIERLKRLLGEGVIARMGVVVRNQPSGPGADALVVFEVSRHAVDMVGERLAEAAWVNRCHRCVPRAPSWPYNLHCTLHGRDVARLICRVDEEFFGTVRCPGRALLFCRACYGAYGDN